MPSPLLKCSLESRNISPEAPFSRLFTLPAKFEASSSKLVLPLKASFLKFHFLWGQSAWVMLTLRSTAWRSWNKSCCLRTTPPQYQALVSFSQASTHASNSMLCFTKPGVFTGIVHAGSKTFHMCQQTAQKNLLRTNEEMKLDQRRLKQQHRGTWQSTPTICKMESNLFQVRLRSPL